jgi:putative heme iron utilization protein
VDLAEAKATAMRQRGRIEARATIAKRQKKLMSRCKAAVNQSSGLTDIDRERSALVEEKHFGKRRQRCVDGGITTSAYGICRPIRR